MHAMTDIIINTMTITMINTITSYNDIWNNYYISHSLTYR